MKFLADVPVPLSVVAWLRANGHEGYHASERHLEAATDLALLERARQEGRLVITMDMDFPRLLALAYARGPSLILFRIPNPHPGVLVKQLGAHLPQFLEALQRGAIVVFEADRVRVRQLPVIPPPAR